MRTAPIHIFDGNPRLEQWAMISSLLLGGRNESTLDLARRLSKLGVANSTIANPERVRELLLKEMPDLLIINLDSVRSRSAQSIGKLIRVAQLQRVMEILCVSSSPSYRDVVFAMQIRATQFFQFPEDQSKFLKHIAEVQESTVINSRTGPKVSKTGRGLLVGESFAMRQLYRIMRKVAPTELSVLLSGESGTGKEVVARSIHELSRRQGQPYVAVNCGAIAKDLIESELFGHAKGSFTGAERQHSGYFARAEGGTLFLDEVTEMCPELQVKLLRVLEMSCYRPVGGSREIDSDVRIIASTNRDPAQAMEDGVLRKDLYYRLAHFPIRIPALRERADDVSLLANYFLSHLNAKFETDKKLNPELLEALEQYDWPGNVRELRSIMQRLYILSGEQLSLDDLPLDTLTPTESSDDEFLRLNVGNTLADIRREAIALTMQHHEGKKPVVAETLGISLKTLYTSIKRFNLSEWQNKNSQAMED